MCAYHLASTVSTEPLSSENAIWKTLFPPKFSFARRIIDQKAKAQMAKARKKRVRDTSSLFKTLKHSDFQTTSLKISLLKKLYDMDWRGCAAFAYSSPHQSEHISAQYKRLRGSFLLKYI